VLPKNNKIKRKDFPKRISHRNTYHSPHLTLIVFTKNKNSTSNTQVSFVVSKKISKKATKRNLLKRRGYSAIKKVKSKIIPNFICVFYFKNKPIELNYSELEKEISTLLKKAKVY